MESPGFLGVQNPQLFFNRENSLAREAEDFVPADRTHNRPQYFLKDTSSNEDFPTNLNFLEHVIFLRDPYTIRYILTQKISISFRKNLRFLPAGRGP